MINSNFLNQTKQFQVRRGQLPKGSPLLKPNQAIQSTIRNSSLLSDQPQHLKIKQFEETEQHYNPFERRIQKQTQIENKQDNIFQFKNTPEMQINSLNQINMQLISKNKILCQKLKHQQKINEQLNLEIKRLSDIQSQFDTQVQMFEMKISKQKEKKKQLKEQVENLKQELEEIQEKYQNTSNQDINYEEDEQESSNNIPLTHNQLYQLMQYLQQRAHHQQLLTENFQEYQDQEIDPDAMTYEQLLELEEQIGNVSKGLTLEQIKAIPKRELEDDDIPEDKCPVCLFEFKEKEKVRDLQCKHIYHSKCIKSWLQSNKQCPLCKAEVVINQTD